ncbi:uncharacterized protein LOC128420545 isoform X2 [Podarcis raffonei]|uniref:uncharacterized protein LOC128420545 isoform X2 n=1 Tax=Podarcis raffonei TaxID=65483 RepID=UPI0023295199|nr:uncharacterized protein LOC128420545 isoform X2 [Podarcis raffonei]
MGSIIAAAMLTYLYVKEVQRRAIFEEGTTKILQMVEDTFPDLFEADDITKFKKAENISAAISEEKKKISELQQAISDIHHRLREEWIVWHGALYIFDFIATPRTWKQCIQYCERMKYETKLLCVESDEEQAFAVSRVKNKPTDYFIGVSMVGSEWHCYDRSFRIKKLYWGYNLPANKGPAKPDTTNCVIIRRGCEHMYSCWRDVYCHDLKRCICKRKPIEKWMK